MERPGPSYQLAARFNAGLHPAMNHTFTPRYCPYQTAPPAFPENWLFLNHAQLANGPETL